MYDFANLLFAGHCNARCPFCIGKQIDPLLRSPNLNDFPPRNLEVFIEQIQQHAIRQVVFTGTNTDPQLYRHEERLLEYLRRRLHHDTRFSLHTNGRLAQRKIAIFNQYDRVCLSFPSFNPSTYQRMMGVPHPPNLEAILRQARRPVKISCLVTEANIHEIGAFLARCAQLGIQRLVLRKLYGSQQSWDTLLDLCQPGLHFQSYYRGNPVYKYAGMEVTLWDFDQTGSASLNLFSSGKISAQYLLAKTQAD